MSVRNLRRLFHPTSVAVIGASNTPQTPGAIVMRNLLTGDFEGPIMPVAAGTTAVQGVLAYDSVEKLPMAPELAVMCGPPDQVVGQLESLAAQPYQKAESRTWAAVVVTPGLGRVEHPEHGTAWSALSAFARRTGIRVLGTGSLGFLTPGAGINASLAPVALAPGRVAFVSQSVSLCSAVLDWAQPNGIGFSHFVSLGDACDVDFGDLLDYLGSDPQTRAILLYVESIRERRNFMSAARAAARNKPVLVIKAGRREASAKAAASHTGALAGSDLVYDAAIRRAGMLRVYDIEELFAAVETLTFNLRPRGDRLAIVTNGGGIAVMGVDELADLGGTLANLSQDTLEKLHNALPGTWSGENPVDVDADAPPSRYVDALNVLTQAREVDAVLCMHAPVATADASEIAQAVVGAARKSRRVNVATCWVGEAAAEPARKVFHEAGVTTFTTPRQAVQAFMHTVQYRRNQELLMETPPSLPTDFTPNRGMARRVIEHAIATGRSALTEPEAKAVLSAYGIPTVETHIARTPEECRLIAERMGGLLAVKIISPDISHKSDRGGVILDLEGPEAVARAAADMHARLSADLPDARLEGFSVQRMEHRPGARELIIGVTTDAIFGPVVMFGEGGVAVEVIADRAVALPPLNMALARELIGRTRVARLLPGYRGTPGVDIDALCLALVQVSQLVIDLPELQDLDINPLLSDQEGVTALDARLSVAATTVPDHRAAERLAIRPYPRELEEYFPMPDGTPVLLRPIRPEDEPNHHRFISRLTPEDIRFRFFGLVQELPHSQMARMTQIDYDREMAFIAVTPGPGGEGEGETLGVVRAVNDPDNETTEFSIVVRSDLKGSGLGRGLMVKIIRYCRDRGTRIMVGQVLKENARMLAFVERLGFRRTRSVDVDVVEVELELQADLPYVETDAAVRDRDADGAA